MTGVMQGDRQALATLYDRHAQALAGYLGHLTGDAAVAEELVQDLFVIVWRDAGRFRGDSTVRSWLFGIAHKLGLMELRHKRPESLDEAAADSLAAPDPDPADLADLALDRERLQMAMEALPAAHRAVIEMTFYHGLNRAEVAQALNCPVGTVKSRLHYALQALARVMVS
jgi:RNA polymerase sigma-70 factor (ECF subfamily)